MSAADIAQQDTADLTTPVNPDAKKLFAGFGRRIVSVYFDVLIAAFLMQAIPARIMEAIDPDFSDFQEPYIAVLVLYFAAFWASPMRATPAQFLLGVRVVNESGNRLSLSRAIARSVLLIGLFVAAMMLFIFPTTVSLGIVSLLAYVLLFLAALTPNRQAAHDLLVHSLVVSAAALQSSELRTYLNGLASDDIPASGKRWWSSVISNASDVLSSALMLVIPVIVMYTAFQVSHDRDMRYRTIYAVSAVEGLQNAVYEYYVENSHLPANATELGTGSRTDYPDGGYYELEEDGVIRIRFTVKPELKKGSIVLSPRFVDEQITWDCRSEGDFATEYLRSSCRK